MKRRAMRFSMLFVVLAGCDAARETEPDNCASAQTCITDQSAAGTSGANGAPGENASTTAAASGSNGSLSGGATSGDPTTATTSNGGGQPTSGTQDDAGAADLPAPQGTSGCGATSAPKSGTFTIDVDGTARTYIVDVPDPYDANKPYKLVFAWHGLGSTAEQIAGTQWGGAYAYYGLRALAQGSTIFVAGQGLDSGQGGAGWPNTNGRDVAFVQKLLDRLKSEYCIDGARIFSVGMSYGGIMSNTIGCELGDVLRAIAPMAGMGPGFGFGAPACKGQVAVWLAHGNADDVVQFSSGEASRDHWASANHCDTQTQPTDPSPCVAFQGCDSGMPVHFCEFDGGHTIPSFAADAIWSFFSQF